MSQNGGVRAALHRLSRPSVVCAASVVTLALCGCGSSGLAGSGDVGAFRSSFAGQRAGLRALQARIDAEVLHAHGLGDSRLAARADQLSAVAEQRLAGVAQLNAPPRFNTRVRDLHAAVTTVADDLAEVAAAARQGSAKATRAALATLGADSGVLTGVETRLAQTLGPAAG